MRYLSLFILCVLLASPAFSQQDFGKGLNFDDKKYMDSPQKPPLMTKDFVVIPKSFSLRKYCPTPRNQGQYSTCVGWSTAYAGRSIIEAKAKGLTDQTKIDENAFSGLFIYHFIKDAGDDYCQNGTFIDDALSVMSQKGAAKYGDLPQLCTNNLPSNILTKAQSYKIQGYARLYSDYDTYDKKLKAMKKSVSQSNPVIIGMKVAPSFYNAKSLWQPASTESPYNNYGGHAMCVIGYDDKKYADDGAFEIMNSWGSTWGENGFVWIKYKDFFEYTKYAYEMIAIPQNKDDIVDLSGELELKETSGKIMEAQLIRNDRGIGFYKLLKPYGSGTKFRVYVSNNEPAYVYVIGSDATKKMFQLFPPEPNISAALNYSDSHIALPDESYYIQLDNTKGDDYLCILYSKEELNIDDIRNNIGRQQGDTFADKVYKALSNKLVKSENTTYNRTIMNFRSKSGDNSVVAVVVAIQHI